MTHNPANDPNQGTLTPPRRKRLLNRWTCLWLVIIWIIGQLVEMHRAHNALAEATQATVRSAARNNNLTITYDSPSLIGPWAGTLVFQIIVGLVVLLVIVRWIIRRVKDRRDDR